VTNEQYFEETFNEEAKIIFDDANKEGTDYAIMFTKTDYDRFNLKKYVLSQGEKELTSQDIISFINDVRMKKIDPQYKTEKTPSEAENRGVLRKIVGSNFISEVYEKQGQSTIVLFIDSKDESSYKDVKSTLE
jgi:hypothetical protein